MFFSRLLDFFRKAPCMTIMVKKNPGLKHHECGGGSVTLITDRETRKNTASCSRCGSTAEFDLIYEKLFDFIIDDGKPRKIPVRRYRDKPVKKHLVLTAH